MKKTAAILTLVFALSVVIWACVLQPLCWAYVYDGVMVDGVAIGGKTREEIAQLLAVWKEEYKSKTVSVYFGETNFHMNPASIEFELDVEGTAQEAWDAGRRGSWWERLKIIKIAKKEGYPVRVHFRYNEARLNEILEAWKEKIEKPARNAALSLTGGDIIPQETGRKVEVDELRTTLLQALRNPETVNMAIPVSTVYPDVTSADIVQSGIKERLGFFSTEFDQKDVNRTANIKLAVRRINGHMLYPGQIFSFNEVVGPRDAAHGFKEAMEIIDGEFVPGIGGGICQVSSTLYNAMLLANLAVVERSNHSKPLGYVGMGRDATVAYGVIDFQFRNTLSFPVMIMAETDGNKIMIGLFGQERSVNSVEILAADRRIIPPETVRQEDRNLYAGETKLEKKGKPGYEVTTIRVVRFQGKEIKREILSKDRYLPENTVIRVGSKLPDFT